MKNILICLEQLGIGGVETFSISQAISLKKNGYNPIVMSKGGILLEKLNQYNIKHVDFKFELKNYFDVDKRVEKIIKDYKVDIVFIHQFPCISYLLPILITNNIPYISYNHSIVSGTYEWFINNYSIYRMIFPFFFKNAYKIYAISEKTKIEIVSMFKIDTKKINVINNCVDFDEYDNNIDLSKKDNLVWYGRFSKEKSESIKSAIKFFNEYKKNHKNSSLTFIGDGPTKNDFIEMTKNDKSICYRKSSKTINKDLKEYGIVLGVDRSVIEAIASNKIILICSYEGNIIYVNPNNIKKLSKVNYSGIGMKTDYKSFFNLSDEELINNSKKNYEYCYKNNNINNTIMDLCFKSAYNKETKQELEFIIEASKCIRDVDNKLNKTTKDYNDLVLENHRLYSELINKNRIIEKMQNKLYYKIEKKIWRGNNE